MKNVLLLLSLFLANINLVAQNTLYISTGTIFKPVDGALLVFNDMNLQNEGSINQSSGDGKFYFSGTANNVISGTKTALIDILEIAKTGGAKISLQQNVNIGSAINFITGLIEVSTDNNIILTQAAMLVAESETSRITGTNGGYIEITNTLNAPANTNPGNLGALISSAANLGSTTIRRGHQSQTNGAGAGNSVHRYFDIIPTNNTALNATLIFKYFDTELNGLSESSLSLWKSVNNTHWTNQGFDRRSTFVNTVEKNNIADFSRWTLSTPGNALPVQFLLFNVKCNGNATIINWKTATEINSSHFEVQRSSNGVNWTSIGTVTAAGNSSTEKSYAFADNNPLASAFYRIADFDIVGRTQYTSIIKSNCSQQDYMQLLPNPVTTILYANIAVAEASVTTISIYDAKGSLVKQQQNPLLSGSNQVAIDMSRYTNGIYHVVASWNNGLQQQSFKIMKQ